MSAGVDLLKDFAKRAPRMLPLFGRPISQSSINKISEPLQPLPDVCFSRLCRGLLSHRLGNLPEDLVVCLQNNGHRITVPEKGRYYIFM